MLYLAIDRHRKQLAVKCRGRKGHPGVAAPLRVYVPLVTSSTISPIQRRTVMRRRKKGPFLPSGWVLLQWRRRC